MTGGRLNDSRQGTSQTVTTMFVCRKDLEVCRCGQFEPGCIFINIKGLCLGQKYLDVKKSTSKEIYDVARLQFG